MEKRLAAWNQAAGAYRPGVGSEFNFKGLEKALQPVQLFSISELVQQYQQLFAYPPAPKIAAALHSINVGFAELYTRTSMVSQNFRNQYDYATQLFGFYVFRLTQLNDHLSQRIMENRLHADFLSFASDYTEIFKDWTSSGVNKSIQELNRDVVNRIVRLNEQHPNNPIFQQIAEYTGKCERAFEITEGLDRRIKELHEDGRLVLTRALRIIRCVSGAGAFKSATSDLNEPAYGTPPKVEKSANSSAQPVSFSEWVKGLRDNPDNNVGQSATNKLADSHNTDGRAGRKGMPRLFRAKWVAVIAFTAFLIASGSYVIWHKPRETNTEGNYAGVSHPHVEGADRIHTFNHHHALIRTQLDSVHRLIKIDSLRKIISSTPGDTTKSTKILAKIDSLKLRFPQADFPDLLYGIDVSVWQQQIDWSLVAQDASGPSPIHFAILRATSGLQPDHQFLHNWSNAQNYIPVVGAYHFLHFLTDPVKQANLFIESAPLSTGNIRPILDIETNCKDCDPTMGLTIDELIAHIKDYLRVIEAYYDTKAILYSNVYYYNTYLKDRFPEHDFWLAEYRGDQGIRRVIRSHQNPPDTEVAVMWQFSSTGRITGINPQLNVDLNFLKSTYLDRIKID